LRFLQAVELAMTAWDVVMDPIIVTSDHWVWAAQGAYYGIPLQNFCGWRHLVFTWSAYHLARRMV
jgi:uncharacterized membrane protein